MEPKMNNDPVDAADDPRRLLSAMADGEADASEIGRGCAAWAADAQLGERWHAYHLIGDVLRSDDLASPPRRDQAFLERLSARLDAEPAVLAPGPARPAPRQRPVWAVPAALAAGVMGLATVLVVAIGPSGGGAPSATLAAASAVPGQAAPAVATASFEPVPTGGRVVRDEQLDRYLRAHRDYATALPGSLPGGPGRSTATVSFER
jgi:sigma-E factor negative regulatory protein RseA